MQQMATCGQIAVGWVGTFNHHPRRLADAGFTQRLIADLHKLFVVLEVVPFLRCHAPSGFGVGGQRLQARFGRRLGQVKPQLDEHHTFGHQHAFKLADALQPSCKTVLLVLTVYARFNWVGIPRTKQNTDVAFGRQHLPKAVQLGVLQCLAAGQRAKSLGADVARIHPLVENVDRLTLARTIHTVDQNDHRRFGLLQQTVLRVQQRFAQFGGLLFEGFFVDAMPNFCRLKHGGSPPALKNQVIVPPKRACTRSLSSALA